MRVASTICPAVSRKDVATSRSAKSSRSASSRGSAVRQSACRSSARGTSSARATTGRPPTIAGGSQRWPPARITETSFDDVEPSRCETAARSLCDGGSSAKRTSAFRKYSTASWSAASRKISATWLRGCCGSARMRLGTSIASARLPSARAKRAATVRFPDPGAPEMATRVPAPVPLDRRTAISTTDRASIGSQPASSGSSGSAKSSSRVSMSSDPRRYETSRGSR